MPPGHATEGLQAAQVIRAELPATPIIVLSAHVEVDEAMDLLAGGERTGYLLKAASPTLPNSSAPSAGSPPTPWPTGPPLGPDHAIGPIGGLLSPGRAAGTANWPG